MRLSNSSCSSAFCDNSIILSAPCESGDQVRGSRCSIVRGVLNRTLDKERLSLAARDAISFSSFRDGASSCRVRLLSVYDKQQAPRDPIQESAPGLGFIGLCRLSQAQSRLSLEWHSKGPPNRSHTSFHLVTRTISLIALNEALSVCHLLSLLSVSGALLN